MATNESFDVIPVPLMEAALLERVSRLARACFPPGSTVEWSDEFDERGDAYGLMTVRSPVPPATMHESYLSFIHAWVRAEPPEDRARIRLSCLPGAGG